MKNKKRIKILEDEYDRLYYDVHKNLEELRSKPIDSPRLLSELKDLEESLNGRLRYLNERCDDLETAIVATKQLEDRLDQLERMAGMHTREAPE